MVGKYSFLFCLIKFRKIYLFETLNQEKLVKRKITNKINELPLFKFGIENIWFIEWKSAHARKEKKMYLCHLTVQVFNLKKMGLSGLYNILEKLIIIETFF